MNESATTPAVHPPRWRPLNSIDRRVLGVLGEKAKTTPDAYPMTLNGLVAGCNQKSNRSPVLTLEADQVEESLDRLREFGAVALVEGSGRVQKYRHYLYEWLGVGKIELSVMIELLLRGEQTVGELRGRASRMDPIDDLNALRELLNSLKDKRAGNSAPARRPRASFSPFEPHRSLRPGKPAGQICVARRLGGR